MIQNLTIKNFKSIKELSIPCKKLNVFIGEPNSGKSNIIEAMALRSQNAVKDYLNKEIFRYKTIGDLFCDFKINDPIEVYSEKIKTVFKFAVREDGIIENLFHLYSDTEINKPTTIMHDGKLSDSGDTFKTNVRYYKYKETTSYLPHYLPHLSPPHGENLPTLLLSNQELKKWVSEFLQSKGLRLTLKPVEHDIMASKLVDFEIYPYPYISLSETVQRIIFYFTAIESNNNCTLLFDEPDTNTFPAYTKELAELIAMDKTNQFFIATHNPYLLISLLEKSAVSDINLFITEMKDYETNIHLLNDQQLSLVLEHEADVFFNFDQILSV